MAARRLLAGDEALSVPEVAAFAIELLADRAIATPGWETTAKPPPPIVTTAEPGDIAKVLSVQPSIAFHSPKIIEHAGM